MLSLVLTGCGESHATVSPAEPTPAAAYKAGHGVQLTPTACKFVGLKTADVTPHTFTGADAKTKTSAVPAIPTEALLRTVKGDFVYVANGGWYLRTPVTLGASDATHFEIKDGLYEGDTIVIQGVNALSLAEISALNGGVSCCDVH